MQSNESSQKLKRLAEAVSLGELTYPLNMLSPKGNPDFASDVEMLTNAVELDDNMRAAMTLAAIGATSATEAIAELRKRSDSTTDQILLGVALFDLTGSADFISTAPGHTTANLFAIERLKRTPDTKSTEKMMACLDDKNRTVRFAAIQGIIHQQDWEKHLRLDELGQCSVLTPLHILRGRVRSSLPELRDSALLKLRVLTAIEGWAASPEELGLTSTLQPDEELADKLMAFVIKRDTFSDDELRELPEDVRVALQAFALNLTCPEKRNPLSPRVAALLSRSHEEREECRLVLKATRDALSDDEKTEQRLREDRTEITRRKRGVRD